ncbi:MAG: undecaprenyl-phosphate glucose phosphotransferase [Betaproteobacteria bacterium]|nr:MAG: undecaprenyl-phosphate glucose phosphotransferase [Betaproteobacteria bacterium]
MRSILRESSTLLDVGLRIFDPLLVIVMGFVAYRMYLGQGDPPARYIAAIFGVGLLAFAVFPSLALYHSQRGISFFDEVRALVLAWFLIAVIGGAFLFLSKTGIEFSRGWALTWILGGLAAHFATRAALRLVLRTLRKRGRNLRHIVIVGTEAHARGVAARLRAAPWSGLAVRAFYASEPVSMNASIDGVPVAGAIEQLATDLLAHPVDQVWIALPLRAEEQIRRCLESLRSTSAVLRFVPDIYSFHLLNHSVGEVAGMPVLNLTDTPLDGAGATWKAIEDYLLGLAITAIVSPLILAIALGVKLSSRGPVLYRQERVTWNGRRFTMLKFRTMPADAEAESGPVWMRRGEKRTTALGAILRRFSLDELPQLVNVLRGDMSLVGPRPERPDFVAQFRDRIPGYMQKHLVKAGITGWAQVNDLRGDSDLAQRIQYDLYYIEHWSIWFDLRILALTLWHILKTRNAF